MPYRSVTFINNAFYHVFNRGVEKRLIFMDNRDYERFLQTLFYYQFDGPKPRFSTHTRFKDKNFEKNPKIVEIVCYCLMPNHFHLLIKQNKNNGVQEFLRKVIDSYTKYFNTKHNRVGHLFQGQFKAVLVETDEQLLHLSRYIHLNPYMADLTNNWEEFIYSSFLEFSSTPKLCVPNYILDHFKNYKKYRLFIKDHESYALEIEKIRHLVLDQEK